MSITRKFIQRSRSIGKTSFYDKNFRDYIIPTMKEGQTIGIPVNGGVAIFEFKGINKSNGEIIFKEMDVI